MKKRGMGWMPDLPDHRDLTFAAVRKMTAVKMPMVMDLRGTGCLPAVYDQGRLGSCTANAIAAAVDFDRVKQGQQAIQPSRLFIYYNERAMEGTIGQDVGAQIRDGVKSVAKQGVCQESIWPYDPEKFARKPIPRCFRTAERFQTLEYRRIDNTNLKEMLACIADGFPFVFGFTVYDGFMGPVVAATGTLNLPGPKEKMQGGHAVLAVGYDRGTQRFLVRNSWGTGWGMQEGHFTIPFEYLTNDDLAADFWTLRRVE